MPNLYYIIVFKSFANHLKKASANEEYHKWLVWFIIITLSSFWGWYSPLVDLQVLLSPFQSPNIYSDKNNVLTCYLLIVSCDCDICSRDNNVSWDLLRPPRPGSMSPIDGADQLPAEGSTRAHGRGGTDSGFGSSGSSQLSLPVQVLL